MNCFFFERMKSLWMCSLPLKIFVKRDAFSASIEVFLIRELRREFKSCELNHINKSIWCGFFGADIASKYVLMRIIVLLDEWVYLAMEQLPRFWLYDLKREEKILSGTVELWLLKLKILIWQKIWWVNISFYSNKFNVV